MHSSHYLTKKKETWKERYIGGAGVTIQNKKPTVGFKNCEKQKKHTIAFSSTKPYKLSVLQTNTDYLIKKRNELLTVLSSDYPDVVRCAIWYDLYNLKNMKNTHRGV